MYHIEGEYASANKILMNVTIKWYKLLKISESVSIKTK